MSGLARYSRQIVLREVGVNGQNLLRDSTALIVGIGGLGSAAALYLAGAGIGRLLLADRDRVDLTNLQRQILYRHGDLGRPKNEAACAQLADLNPEVRLEGCGAEEWPGRISEADVVLDCSDNFPTRSAVNAACVRAKKPLVSGAAIRFEGQLAVFDLRRGGPCYACLYPAMSPAPGDHTERCEDAGILGPVAGTVGAMQALAALQLLLGIHDQVSVLHLWDARRLHWRSLKIRPDPQCPLCGPSAGGAEMGERCSSYGR